MVRVDVVAGQPPVQGPAPAPAPAPSQGPPHDMYCSPYGEFYPQDHYYVPPPEMCPQPPHMCTMHGDYDIKDFYHPLLLLSQGNRPVMPMGTGSGGLGVPVQVGHVVQQIVDESGTVRHVILSAQPPPPPPHLQHPPPPPPPHHMQHPPPPPQHQTHQPHPHQQQHYGPANGGNGPQQFFGPHGYPPPPHYHPMGPPPPPPHHHMPPPHSPPQPYHKDERAQRQYVKLRKKLEQKQIRNDGLGLNSGYSTPALSPRKEFSNGVRARSGGSMVGGTSSEGEGSSSAATSVQGDEEDSQPLLDFLSSLQTPRVSEVTARSALVQWSPPSVSEGNMSPPHSGELRYELLLGDKGRYKAIYSGPSLSCRVQDLRPGTEYSVCLQAHCEGVIGAASGAAMVRTPPCEPATPIAPRAAQRTRTSLQLRWNAPQDNGAHIQHYILQYDEGKGGDFVDLSTPRTKQHNLQKLEGSTKYRFRLAAVNEVGKSSWSEEVAYWTCGSPPSPPAPPVLVRAYSTALVLRWVQRPGDEEFTVQREDERNRHGYLPVFSGRGTETRCDGLIRYSDYKFRLQAHNEEGGSRWSDEVVYRTLPECPSPPSKPYVKGKIHAHSFRVKWDPPTDRGGTEIQFYTLEIKSGSEFEPIYNGPELEANCDRLQPGHTYRLRVSCTTVGGSSGWSDIQNITTEAVIPGPCSPPTLFSEPRPNSLSVEWIKPDYDGGSPILEYNVEITHEENSRLVYKGKETECTVQELLPGRQYSFRVKAFNKVGGGPWSDSLQTSSGAAPPEPPLPPKAVAKSPFSIFVQWVEPPCNGGTIIDYRLDMCEKFEDNVFSTIYRGILQSYEVKNLIPFTMYSFRVSASNKAGQGEWSMIQTVTTPAAVPAAPPALRAEATASDAQLSWKEPEANGSPISHYRIDIGDQVYFTEGPILEYHLEDLLPETAYRVRVQAVNDIGIGNFSPTLKFETLPPPPLPPPLECVQQGHNFLKLKWGEGKNTDYTEYIIEMQSPRRKEYQTVYRGTSLSFRVKKLQECTKYRFRICAINDVGGQGDFSEPLEWETAPAPPLTLKAPKQVELCEHSCLIEWTPHRPLSDEPVTFIVHCCRTKDMEYKEVYRGTETSMRIEELESGCEYSVRVCAERVVGEKSLLGAWSPSLVVATPSPAPVLPSPPLAALHATVPTANGTKRSARKPASAPMSDHQFALLLLAGFLSVALIFAIALEHFIDWRKSV